MEEEIEENRQSKLGECDVCGSANALYTCPRCEVKTCSLNCVKIHKKEINCNGDRDKVGYVPLSEFSDLNLQSDYRFLEDINRTIENCKKNPLKKFTRYKKPLPQHLYLLRNEAFRRNTSLQFLPQHFTRRKENTTSLNFKKKIIYWRLEFIFPHADNIKIVLEKCDENEKLGAALSRFVDYETCPQLYKKNLKYYHSTGVSGLEVLLKAENTQEQSAFFVLDMSSTIKENLEDRIIIEYPILYVIFKTHKDEYLILDSDVKVEFNFDKMRRSFTEFTPFSYFDTITYSKKPTKGDEAFKSINSSAKELRKYFANYESDDEMEEENDENVIGKPESKEKHRQLSIPTYEDLVKNNY